MNILSGHRRSSQAVDPGINATNYPRALNTVPRDKLFVAKRNYIRRLRRTRDLPKGSETLQGLP